MTTATVSARTLRLDRLRFGEVVGSGSSRWHHLAEVEWIKPEREVVAPRRSRERIGTPPRGKPRRPGSQTTEDVDRLLPGTR
ncbi:hypothetical protein [Micromonospora sp. NPDC049282]|uniref:hypothetical protein n=1 Tax=Micromonospora sp. NPDC049282 TaxID=3364269 RepID=UPI003719C3D5